jgi:hypothetical protein
VYERNLADYLFWTVAGYAGPYHHGRRVPLVDYTQREAAVTHIKYALMEFLCDLDAKFYVNIVGNRSLALGLTHNITNQE